MNGQYYSGADVSFVKVIGLLMSSLVIALGHRRKQKPESLGRFLLAVLRDFAMFFFAIVSRRVRVVLTVYAWFRCVDDVIDGDAPCPGGTPEQYLTKKKSVLQKLIKGGVWVSEDDIMLAYALTMAKKMDFDLTEELSDLFQLMADDFKRRVSGHLFSERERIEYATAQDRAILGCVAKVFSGSVIQLATLLVPAEGVLTRIDWLKDCLSDLHKGIVYISQEDAQNFNLDFDALSRATSWFELMAVPGFTAWYRRELGRLTKLWVDLESKASQEFSMVFSQTWLAKALVLFLFPKFRRSLKTVSERSIIGLDINSAH
ncbi:MAG TPA: hypothetical protein VJK04_01250 [Candidatus Paceibacterota bacterium]